MKAGIIKVAGTSPVYGDFNEPVAGEGQELITVSASALSQFSKSRSSGSHYSSSGTFPSVAGADGVGRTADGRRVYFVMGFKGTHWTLAQVAYEIWSPTACRPYL
ncbi:MAG: hypothetical protein WB795_22120 [Candidatus Acidiferrales bacterium]